MLGAETPDFIQLNVGILCPRHGGTSNPPVGTGQPGGQIGAGSRLPVPLPAARMRYNFAMRWLP